MKILIVHLSDIHITGSEDRVLSRSKAIIDAVKNLDYTLDFCVIVASGDLAYAGAEDQYLLCMEFFEEIRKGLQSSLVSNGNGKVPVHIVAVPGNHDCTFEGSSGARDLVVEGVLKATTQATDPSIIQACVAVQDFFFQFQKAVAATGLVQGDTDYDCRLYYEYRFSINGEAIRFLCCNTAWLSRLHEKPGTLYFPPAAIPEHVRDSALAVAVFHHPYNWLEPTNLRAIRKRVEAVTDLILTGHEHDATRRSHEGGRGERNLYVEGGALQDSEYSTASAFNAFVLDTTTRKQKFVHLVWDEELYVPVEGTAVGAEGGGLSWEEFQVNRLRQRGRFELSDDMKTNLDDPGVSLVHRDRGILKLIDVFVFPDLREVNYIKEGVIREGLPLTIRGEHVPDYLRTKPRLLITGDSQAGKTCLAKMIFRRLLDDGYVPVLMTGSIRPPTDDRLFGHIENLFAEQYEVEALAAYRQLDRERRVLIVDDYHTLSFGPSARQKFLTGLTKFAGHIVLFAHDMVLVDNIANPVATADSSLIFDHFRIQPFGYLRRNQLVEKWLLLNSEADADSASFAHQLDTINRVLHTLIGKNFVPAFPVYILSVLQANEASTPIDTRASTHGYFYELFIRANLTRGRNRVEYDVTAAYLAHLAHDLFVNHTTTFDLAAFKELHTKYEQRYDITLSFEGIRQELVLRQILECVDDLYRFKYRYAYYFFVASYMRDHINETAIRTYIASLSRTVYMEENANILLFLAHLSKDPVIIDEMQAAAEELYRGIVPSEFLEDVKFINELDRVASEVVYEDRDPATTRSKMLEALDKAQEANVSKDAEQLFSDIDPAKALVNPIIAINAALKTVQILGQILKNFPGSMEGPTKLVMARSCYNLTLRCLSSILASIHSNEKALLREIVSVVREHHPSFDDEEVQQRALDTVSGMARFIAFGMIKRTSHAVGSRDLTATYNRILEENSKPSVQLIHTSILLDHADNFPEIIIRQYSRTFKDNPLSLWILRYLTIQHFYLFPVDFKKKQGICQALGISYAKIQKAEPGQKMIPRPSRDPR